MKRFVALVAILCSTQVNARHPTMEADPSEVGLEGISLVNELMLAYRHIGKDDAGAVEWCGKILPSYQERGLYPYKRYTLVDDGQGGKRKVDFPFACYVFKEVKDDGVARHVRAGLALSDLYCDTFFRRISERSSERHFARSAVNDVGAAISAVLGLSSAGTRLTGGVGTLFGLFDSTFRNYDDTFLVASDLPGLQNLVRGKQEEYRKQIVAHPPTTYEDATIIIIRYANFCSFTGMRALLNKSITESSDPSVSRARMVEAIAQYDAMAQDIKDRRDAIIKEQAAKAAVKQGTAGGVSTPASGSAGGATGAGGATTDNESAPPEPLAILPATPQ